MLRTIRATLRRDTFVPRLAPLAVALNTLGIGTAVAAPQFNLDFLRGAQNEDDVAMLSSPGSVLPGTYPFSVYLNGDEIAREDIRFERLPSGEVQPCLTQARLRAWSIRLSGGQRAPRKAGARGHGKPADRGAHAHAHTGKPATRPARSSQRFDSRA